MQCCNTSWSLAHMQANARCAMVWLLIQSYPQPDLISVYYFPLHNGTWESRRSFLDNSIGISHATLLLTVNTNNHINRRAQNQSTGCYLDAAKQIELPGFSIVHSGNVITHDCWRWPRCVVQWKTNSSQLVFFKMADLMESYGNKNSNKIQVHGRHDGAGDSVAASQLQGSCFDPELICSYGLPLTVQKKKKKRLIDRPSVLYYP